MTKKTINAIIKNLKHLFTVFLLLYSTAAFAETVVINGITYDVVTKAKVATVIKSETGYSGNIVIPASIKYNGVTYSVTSIGEGAFYNCSGLTSITIGNGVEYIRSEAFAKCGELTDVYCLATTAPRTEATAFNESYPEYMTLHVPAEAINYYKTTEPWSSFGTIVTLDGTEVETPVCETPVITYRNSKLSIECETEGAEFVTSVTCDYINTYYTSSFELAAEYRVSVYATAAGHENSETVNVTLCWIDNGNDNNDNGVINILATAVLVTSVGRTITINCNMNGEKVEVYTTDGVMIGSATIENGTATVNTELEKGSIAIVNIARKSTKVIVG